MNVALEGNHICHAVKMALHISETAVLMSPYFHRELGIPSQIKKIA